MPDYRRFVAYFYEYIDGKKQKNTGFAKVELRNGMWRILFRLMTDIQPDPPVQVFGFVREKGYLLGFPLGNMPNGCEVAEEWAYDAEKPLGHGKYLFANLSGIWIQSGEGRSFITVWDDDPVDLKKFVLKLPKEEKPETGSAVESERASDAENTVGEVSASDAENTAGEVSVPDAENTAGEVSVSDAENTAGEVSISDIENTAGAELVSDSQACSEACQKKSSQESFIMELFQKRQRFQPFSDEEISDCIRLMPCDIVTMQQHGWQVGRSSFLHHGYYQYHHLLLGKNKNGAWVLGVPGVRNPQEQYMAQMFGYGQFKLARVCEHGKAFGYWYRVLGGR